MNLDTGKYWDKAWQLVDGCSPVSAGCENCWSAGMTHRFKDGFTINGKFNGVIRIREDRLNLPLKTKKPTVWAAWNDLFGEDVPMEFIAEVFDVMASCRYVCKEKHEHNENCETEETGHTYLILTKRPERMKDVISELPNYVGKHWEYESVLGITMQNGSWPLENIYLGTSIENQQTDERIPHLLQIPGKKFLSIEPLLSEIRIPPEQLKEISQVICGTETGRNARPCHPDWMRSIRDQCQAAGVPFFLKGWGEWIEVGETEGVKMGDICMSSDGFIDVAKKGYFCFANESEGTHMRRVGHKAAGRLLDGRTHDDLAWRDYES